MYCSLLSPPPYIHISNSFSFSGILICLLLNTVKVPTLLTTKNMVLFNFTFVAMRYLGISFIITYFNSSDWHLLCDTYFRLFHNAKEVLRTSLNPKYTKKKIKNVTTRYLLLQPSQHYTILSFTAFCMSVNK